MSVSWGPQKCISLSVRVCAVSPQVRPLGDTNCLPCPSHSDTSLDACSSGTVLSVYSTLLSVYSILLSVYSTLLSVYSTLPSVYKTARRHFQNTNNLMLVVLLFWGFIILSAVFT
jgi:hypothetical protein